MTRRHDSLFASLTRALDRGALGHALLFICPPQPDSSSLSWLEDFRTLLLCVDRQEGQPACGHCDSCRLFQSVTREEETPYQVPHPDYVEMTPMESSGFKVDDIRSLAERFSFHTSLSPRRVVWIRQADALAGGGSSGPANALLKILEEPRPRTFLMLETTRPDALLPTIRSRCQSFRLRAERPDHFSELSLEWEPLRQWLQSGAPIGAGPRLPADRDDFWKERAEAVKTMVILRETLWESMRPCWKTLDIDQARRVHQLFELWEKSLLAIQAYASPALQWLNFRTHARLDR